MSCRLTAYQRAFVLSLFPPETRVLSAHSMQDLVPCPIHGCVILPEGAEAQVVLRIARNRGGVEREALVLPVLARPGFSKSRVNKTG